jgi:hypothetical protein
LILANHAGYICEHVEKRQLGTLWSMIATPQKGLALIAVGHPCIAKHQKYVVKSEPLS